MSTYSNTFQIALISMPWALFNRPSIQLGTLKSYLENNSDIAVQNFHPYLSTAKNIGLDDYKYLSKNGWAGDALYATLLFPERQSETQKLFLQSCNDNRAICHKFESLLNTIEDSVDRWIADIDLSSFTLIGFSVCFNQLFSSLFTAKKIKQILPQIDIAFGGTSCVGDMGRTLLNQFPQVDHVIDGEGEQQLIKLCDHISDKTAQLIAPLGTSQQSSSGKCEVLDLNTLSTPDYHPYFKELEQIFPGIPFSPTIPIEFSRGCWWEKCTFCNLNLQWHGYRWKKAEKVIAEVEELVAAHSCLDFTFCDNALPEKEAEKFFSSIQQWDIDLSFFAEIRTIKDPKMLKHYRKGGLTSVQVGIESLSPSLLEKMAKGTSVIENLAIMKHCAANDITLEGNLIVEFPGSTPKEVKQTLSTLDFALPFHPLFTATFFLGTGSRVEKDPACYGIRAVTQHRHNTKLFPREMLKNLVPLIKDYSGDRAKQRKLWHPVRQKMKKWQEFHNNRNDASIPPLCYRDGGTFLLIRQERLDGPPLLHRLKGASRRLYLFCSSIKNLEDILQNFSELTEKTILGFFNDLCKKQLLYDDNNKFLALAIRLPR